MKYFIEKKVVDLSGKGSIGLILTEPMRILGIEADDIVNISVLDKHIEIRKKEVPKKKR